MPARPSPDAPARRPIAGFILSTVVALIVVAIVGVLVLRSFAAREARRDTATRVTSAARLLEATKVARGLGQGGPVVLRRVDSVIKRGLLREPVVRVKIWAADGTILYSDAPALIGKRFPLGDEEEEIIADGGSEVEVSDLSSPENRLERVRDTELVEAYTRMLLPDGTPVLLETYQRLSSVSEASNRLLWPLVLPFLAALLAVGLIQVPLVRRLVRRIREGKTQEERLRAHATDASRSERLRLASELQTGAVDAFAPLPERLRALQAGAAKEGRPLDAATLGDIAVQLDGGLKVLRGDVADLLPPRLERDGLEDTLYALAGPLRDKQISVNLHVGPIPAAAKELSYQVVREGLRNIERHARATTVAITVESDGERGVIVTVDDNGVGVTPAERDEAMHAGHRGLLILSELVADHGGTLDLRSGPGEGTTLVATFTPAAR